MRLNKSELLQERAELQDIIREQGKELDEAQDDLKMFKREFAAMEDYSTSAEAELKEAQGRIEELEGLLNKMLDNWKLTKGSKDAMENALQRKQ